jgi:hypothetical protein
MSKLFLGEYPKKIGEIGKTPYEQAQKLFR